MKKTLPIIILFLISSNLFSSTTNLDVYGVDEKTEDLILKHCRKQVEEYVDFESKISVNPPKNLNTAISRFLELRNKAIKQIKQYGKFELVNISTVFYPDKNTRYTTIDIVTSSQKFRFPNSSSSKPISKSFKLTKPQKKVFALWSTYNKNNINLVNQRKYNAKEKNCPVSHCIWGFNKEELINYFPEFKSFANLHTNELEIIIQTSQNNEQRGDAIFILAHSDNYQSTVKFLLNYINDQSALVRNNSLRVIAAILSKHKIENLPLHKLLPILNYYLVTDRNKAANVILNIAKRDVKTHKQILVESGETLIKLLKLKQPNNHDPAYNILKIISNKDYSDTDIIFWKHWLKKSVSNLEFASHLKALGK